MTPYRQRRLFSGQASIEYLVVLAFGVMVLLKPFGYDDVNNPNAAKTEAPALQQLAKAVKDYHKHYSFAMAIAAIPECDYSVSLSFDKTAPSDIASLTGGATVGIDRCIDWLNPSIPAVSVTDLSVIVGLPTDFGSFVQNIVTTMVKDAMNQFLDPSNLLEMVGFPSSASDIIDLILP